VREHPIAHGAQASAQLVEIERAVRIEHGPISIFTARIGNADFPWLPPICSNGTVICTTGNKECARSILLPRRFFLRNLSGIARAAARPRGPLKQCLAPQSLALYFMRRQLSHRFFGVLHIAFLDTMARIDRTSGARLGANRPHAPGAPARAFDNPDWMFEPFRWIPPAGVRRKRQRPVGVVGENDPGAHGVIGAWFLAILTLQSALRSERRDP